MALKEIAEYQLQVLKEAEKINNRIEEVKILKLGVII